MSDKTSQSMKTRSEVNSSEKSSKSSAWKRAQLSKLTAEQAQRAADAAIRRARAHAQRVVEDAEEEARQGYHSKFCEIPRSWEKCAKMKPEIPR